MLLDLRAPLRRYLIARGATADEADDVLQDVFLKIGSGGGGPVADPKAYLYRMVTNQWLDQRRSDARRSRRQAIWVDLRFDACQDRDDRPDSERALLSRERLWIVERLIDDMPDRTATIFRRFRLGEETQKAIAADLGISVSAVEKHLYRAYAALLTARRALDADEDADGPWRPVSEGHDDDA